MISCRLFSSVMNYCISPKKETVIDSIKWDQLFSKLCYLLCYAINFVNSPSNEKVAI